MTRDEELWEHLLSLQAQIDHLIERDEARLQRIAKLERDREVLRKRLEKARSKSLFGRRHKRRSEEDSRPKKRDSQATARTLHVPGVGSITETPPTRAEPRRTLSVAAVLDPISTTVFQPEFTLIPVAAKGWEETLEETRPDLLLVESAYSGADGSWATRIARFGKPSPLLERLVDWCRARSIPTVFWNKEDPINFDWFISSASLFDYVFTVDSDQILRYRETLGHNNVGLLPFFAQPAIHFPGPDAARTGNVAFAGSYFAAKHPERREQIGYVLGPARRFGLDIFDRHADTSDERFLWPEEFRPHIRGGLTYLQTVEAYRRYRVFLNVNTVTASPTMCARRVFELAACGTPILSGPSLALEPLAREGAIAISHSEQETETWLDRLLGDADVRREMAERARRWVLEGNTASDRVDQILEALGGRSA